MTLDESTRAISEAELKRALQAAIEAVIGKLNTEGDAYREFDDDLGRAVAALAHILQPSR